MQLEVQTTYLLICEVAVWPNRPGALRSCVWQAALEGLADPGWNEVVLHQCMGLLLAHSVVKSLGANKDKNNWVSIGAAPIWLIEGDSSLAEESHLLPTPSSLASWVDIYLYLASSTSYWAKSWLSYHSEWTSYYFQPCPQFNLLSRLLATLLDAGPRGSSLQL
jgi:hypothetical protein